MFKIEFTGYFSGINSEDDLPAASMVAEFTEVYTLPGPEVQPMAGDRDGEALAEYRRFKVSRHIYLIDFNTYICVDIIFSTNMKAILLVRVSSNSQEFEEQKHGIIDYAKQFGYKDKDLIIIENEESAIKLNIDERVGIIRTKEAIENDKLINAVFVWEFSRLARNQTDGHLLKDYFFKDKNSILLFITRNKVIQ